MIAIALLGILFLTNTVGGDTLIISPISNEIVDLAYLKPRPYPAGAPVCNCVAFALAMDIKNEPIKEPIIGGSIKTYEGDHGHRVVIIDIEESNFLIIEANYISCQISYRRIPINSRIIKSYTN